MLRRALLIAGLLLGAAAAAQAPPPEPPQQPFLRIEAGAHTAPVARLAVDAAGQMLASVSDDKTLRLWALPEGSQRRVIRPPVGTNEDGELYAVALSPDGARVAAAGFTGQSWDGVFCLYLYDAASGRLLARLSGLPAPVQHLAFSADGLRLAAALGGRAGIRVFDARNGQLLFEDAGYGGPARMLGFDREGRLASSAADGHVRLYDASGRKLADRVPLAGARPFGLAWSPDGGLLAIGYEDRLRVEVLAAGDLRSVMLPDVAGLAGEGMPAVTWAADGRGGVQLHAAGYARLAGGGAAGRGIAVQREAAAPMPAPRREFVVRRWTDFGLGPSTDIPAARDAISHLLALPGGGIAYAAADPGWGRITPEGLLAFPPRPPGADFRATAASLAATEDGTRLRVALRPGEAPIVFDALDGRLEAGGDASGFLPARTASARLPIADWRNSNRPRLGQVPLRLGEGEYARSLAILPREDGFLIGTDNHLRLFDAAGRPVDALAVPGAVWGLTVAGDMAVAALGDGTLRWYRLAGGALVEQAALFIQAETRRWALWTPEGLFDHAANGGQELVGVLLNRGRAQSTEWATFQQAYRALYAPQAVHGRIAGDQAPAQQRLAQLGEVRSRIGRLPVLAAGAACVVVEADCLPLAWDARTLPEGARALRLALQATDRGLGLGPLDVLVNDRIAARAEARPGETVVEVPLDPGPNRIATRLYAEDRTLFADGPALALRRPGDAEPPPDAGRLIVLAIGVNHYANAELDLRFAVPDAEMVAGLLRAGAGSLFRETRVTVLRDAEATRRGVLDALARAAEEAEPGDTFILYIAGHGIRTEPDNRFLFLPADTRDTSGWAALRAQGIDDGTLVAALARIRARDALLLLDTCHAGQLTMEQLSALGNETGRFLLAASGSVQEALDSYDDRNGVFAYALREGLQGKAAMDAEGRVSALGLGEWVTRRVPQLARERQHRQDAVFRTAQRDLRSFPVAQVAK
ncbi:caspase family protein [Belnapia rosea]|uniref:Caspase domain-containing protein n=1 Tax=Belnapia rosea TaxID=938405 RepID=A0A1G6Y103_9PROT|nr:caspase family protein [Belnapia rosea]SDD83397.1 Caspase domain-containing protein [Belnapia rosea]